MVVKILVSSIIILFSYVFLSLNCPIHALVLYAQRQSDPALASIRYRASGDETSSPSSSDEEQTKDFPSLAKKANFRAPRSRKRISETSTEEALSDDNGFDISLTDNLTKKTKEALVTNPRKGLRKLVS